ncbi:DUF6660 family protein [Flavobacterium soyae]|uniref:DUF6660 family protein n=1 Tax=Flavobacterium soyae TaxID=2903098 RepID=A0ABZ2UAR4_9FLAO
MKICVTILSFIVLFLSTVPCSSYAKHSQCGAEKSCDADSHDCGNDCNGKCSPFYSCGTCIGFTISLFTAAISEKFIFTRDETGQVPSYDKFVDSSFICKIWQPPKIA